MAKRSHRLSVRLTDREQIWALVYLLFSYLVLPEILHWLNGYLSAPLGNLWVNSVYFSVNFLMILWIFGNFFRRSLVHIGQNMWDFLLAATAGFAGYWLIYILLFLIGEL